MTAPVHMLKKARRLLAWPLSIYRKAAPNTPTAEPMLFPTYPIAWIGSTVPNPTAPVTISTPPA